MKKMKKLLCFIIIALILISNTNVYAQNGMSLTDLESVVNETADFMFRKVEKPQVGSIGGEWAVLGLSRSGHEIPKSYYDDYYKVVEDYVKSKKGELHNKKYTEYSRIILTMTAIGKDPSNIGGYNLLIPLGDYDKTIYQGLNGPIWALIALDSGNYDIPKNPEAKTQATREKYINRILDMQLPDGGWSLMGGTEHASENEKSDPDITGMALQALAKYQEDARVKTSIEMGLNCLSNLQNEDGGFSSWGTENLESGVQVLVALGELGINIEDPRFVKNGNTVLDSCYKYYRPGNGFVHTLDGSGSNQMASEQGFYGMVSALRQLRGQSSLYRMDDVTANKNVQIKSENKNQLVNIMPVVKEGISFDDIKGHKNQKAIEALASRLIINGKSEKEFDPNANMTRAEFATIVVKALGLSTEGKNVFEDVKESDWFYEFVGTANKYGIVKGISDKEFDPFGTITKEEAVTMVVRACKMTGMEIPEDITTIRDILAQFEDYILVDDWARASMAFAYNEGILESSDLKINPKEAIKRAEIAQMLFNMLDIAELL